MFHRAEGVEVAGRYRLVRKLGTGGMGTVWLAEDMLLDSSCALKLIDDDKSESEEVRIRFAREAKVAAQLRGAHVVDVFDHGEWSGVPYIAMEFLDGEDLGTRLDRVKKLGADATYRIVAHVARALVKAHAYGIVHRDLKPENIFIVEGDEGDIAKVLDFGIAKHDAYSLRDKTTKTGSFLGTPFYVSPEQARGKPTDHRSDLWSLAVIAFQCLTGRPPFESEALGELMGMILYDDMPMPCQRNPELPPELDVWWTRAANRDREQRFESAKDFADGLAEALGISRAIAVPSVAPRRVSLTEIDPALAQDGRETDAPLTNTRHSSIPGHRRGFLSRIRARFITSRMWIRRVPRRQIAVAAVVSGVAAGALLMFGMTQMNSSPATPEAAPVVPAAAVPAETPRPASTPTVFIDELAAAPSPDASAEAGAASPAPSSSVPSGKVGAPGRTPPRGTPAARTPAKKVAKGRDYGI